jgi:hypothetical protein
MLLSFRELVIDRERAMRHFAQWLLY